MKSFVREFALLGFAALLTLSSPTSSFAGSATWNLNPANSDWNTATNWTPATVPNGPSDVASFGVSNLSDVSLSSSVTLNGITFQPGASPFMIRSPSAFANILINGAGVKNNSGIEQTFVADALGHDQGGISFAGSATAGNATYINVGASVRGSFGGGTSFFNTSTAASATFVADGGHANDAAGGGIIFFDSSKAETGTFTIDGGTVNGAGGGHIEFAHTSGAGHAVITANGGSNGATGGTIFFLDDSIGDRANINVAGNGTLDISGHNPPGITVGTLKGDGLVALGSSKLRINNRPDINFDGVISGQGALEKGGEGRLDLTNANTYTGGTNVTDGTLIVDNTSGSATGPGPVRVKSGALGGNGIIAGPVTLGANIPGNGAFLTPGASFGHPGVLTILGPVSFKRDGFLNIGLRTDVAGQVIVNGVTIDGEAQFAFFNNRGINFPVGTVLTVINNTAATPIAGEFQDLAEGLVFTSGSNKFEVSYHGGDGNDLTLTRVP